MTARFDPERHHRRSIRLRGYDYSQAGAYFVTIVAQDRACLFGEIADGGMRLNDAGDMVAAVWDSLTTRFPDIGLDAFVVMPNHVHAIIVLVGAPLVGALTPGATTRVAPTSLGAIVGIPPHGATTGVAPTSLPATVGIPPHGATTGVAPASLGVVVGAFKSLTTVEFAHGVNTHGWPPFPGRLWQRNYYEHIVRDDAALNGIRQYIVDNPGRWAEDPEHPTRQSHNAGEA